VLHQYVTVQYIHFQEADNVEPLKYQQYGNIEYLERQQYDNLESVQSQQYDNVQKYDYDEPLEYLEYIKVELLELKQYDNVEPLKHQQCDNEEPLEHQQSDTMEFLEHRQCDTTHHSSVPLHDCPHYCVGPGSLQSILHPDIDGPTEDPAVYAKGFTDNIVPTPPAISKAMMYAISIYLTKGASCNVAGDGPSAKFYAVAVGRVPGVYHTWVECKAQVDGIPKAKFKAFKNINDAYIFCGDQHNLTSPSTVPSRGREHEISSYSRTDSTPPIGPEQVGSPFCPIRAETAREIPPQSTGEKRKWVPDPVYCQRPHDLTDPVKRHSEKKHHPYFTPAALFDRMYEERIPIGYEAEAAPDSPSSQKTQRKSYQTSSL